MALTWVSALRISVLLILVAAIVLAFYFLPVEQLLRDFLLWVEQDLGPWGPLALAVAYIPLTVLAVPASVLTIGGGYLFGLPIGFVADSVGATLGSGAAFLLGRTIGKPFVVAKLKDYPQFQSVALAIEKSGFKICLLLRLAPLLPFSMLNYLLSVTPITLGPYLLSSWLGMMPITLALVYVGTTLKDLSDVTHKWSELSFGHWASLILSLVVSVMLMVCVTKVAQNALRKALAEHGGDMNGAVAASPELNDVANVPADLNEPLLIKIDSQSHQDHENQRVMKEAAG
ncbi:TVP38/TMEM64 family membrane protein slr0305 isoform X1 [Brassica rapa]|uniref:TVP38/TMEM64 family membrane protein slr0305 isoform X1 n=1 Tax=Brassica campestris TaxID=3711 RepID=UPI0006AB3DFD|nr:TVP38/TMEM64 family membrane protein slr0305 isoform X1 [Brassica rapa]